MRKNINTFQKLSRRSVLLSGIGALTAGLCPSRGAGATSCAVESRAILDEGLRWHTRHSIEELLERITAAGFNVFVPNVWRGDGATWPTNVAPYLAKWAFDDPFRYLLLRAKDYGVEVHPWISIIKRKGDKIRSFGDKGAPAKFFNVHQPEFRAFIKTVIDDFVATYPDIDGLNLDYVRAGGVCNSRFCAEIYHAFTGRDLAKDHADRWRSQASILARNRWQEAAVREIIASARQSLKSRNPAAILSVDAAPWHPQIKREGQDSVKWANEGLVDLVWSMNYQRNPDFEAMKMVRDQFHEPHRLAMIVGNYERDQQDKSIVTRRNAQRVNELLVESRNFNPTGPVALYVYSMLDENQIGTLSSGAFRECAIPDWRCCFST